MKKLILTVALLSTSGCMIVSCDPVADDTGITDNGGHTAPSPKYKPLPAVLVQPK